MKMEDACVPLEQCVKGIFCVLVLLRISLIGQIGSGPLLQEKARRRDERQAQQQAVCACACLVLSHLC